MSDASNDIVSRGDAIFAAFVTVFAVIVISILTALTTIKQNRVHDCKAVGIELEQECSVMEHVCWCTADDGAHWYRIGGSRDEAR